MTFWEEQSADYTIAHLDLLAVVIISAVSVYSPLHTLVKAPDIW